MAGSLGKRAENKAFASYQRLMERQTKRQSLLLQPLRHVHSIASKHNATAHVDAAVSEQQTQSSPVTDVKEVLQNLPTTCSVVPAGLPLGLPYEDGNKGGGERVFLVLSGFWLTPNLFSNS